MIFLYNKDLNQSSVSFSSSFSSRKVITSRRDTEPGLVILGVSINLLFLKLLELEFLLDLFVGVKTLVAIEGALGEDDA